MLLRVDFKPRSPFKTLPESYTLFGAICWGVRVLYGEEFKNSPPFLTSSPVFRKDDEMFFPKPILRDGWGEPKNYNEYKERKKAKKVKYVSEGIFREVLEGKVKTEKELWERVKEAKATKPTLETVNQPHASINRITWTTEGGELYNEEAVYVGSPFSVFVYFSNTDYIPMVKASIQFTQLGGNKSTGMGYAEVDFEEGEHWIKDFIENRTSKVVSLSPTFMDDTFILDKSYYDILPFHSALDNFYEYISRQIWKRRCVYITTGSTLALKEPKNFYGELKPALQAGDKNIYHYGFAFPLYVREEA